MFRRAWESPPSSFHRWLATHPYLWVVTVVSMMVVFGGPSLRRFRYGFEWAMFGASTSAAALAALAGALLTRRRVRYYDSRAPE